MLVTSGGGGWLFVKWWLWMSLVKGLMCTVVQDFLAQREPPPAPQRSHFLTSSAISAVEGNLVSSRPMQEESLPSQSPSQGRMTDYSLEVSTMGTASFPVLHPSKWPHLASSQCLIKFGVQNELVNEWKHDNVACIRVVGLQGLSP